MSDEKPNDFHWKNKLDDVERLPGETFSKEAAWEKLHKRLQGRSRNRKVIWYWLAAACLLLALIIPSLFLANKKENVLVKNNSLSKETKPVSPHLAQPHNTKAPGVTSVVSTEKKLSESPHKKSNNIAFEVDHNTLLKPVRDQKEKEELITQKIADNAMAPVDAVIKVVANLPEKRKLNVVHINELSDPVAEMPNTARNYERHSLRITFINQELNSNPPSSGNTGFNIFKTNPPPSN